MSRRLVMLGIVACLTVCGALGLLWGDAQATGLVEESIPNANPPDVRQFDYLFEGTPSTALPTQPGLGSGEAEQGTADQGWPQPIPPQPVPPQPVPPQPVPPQPVPPVPSLPTPVAYNLPLQCDATVPAQVSPNVAFRQQISVTNPPNSATATGVLFYARVKPSGHLPVYSCQPNCTVTTGLLTASLGTLSPGQTKIVTIDGFGPNVPGTRFDVDYSTRSVELAEFTCNQSSFSVGAVMFQAP